MNDIKYRKSKVEKNFEMKKKTTKILHQKIMNCMIFPQVFEQFEKKNLK